MTSREINSLYTYINLTKNVNGSKDGNGDYCLNVIRKIEPSPQTNTFHYMCENWEEYLKYFQLLNELIA